MLDEITQSVVDRINVNSFSNSSSFFQSVGTPNYFASIIDIHNGQYLASTTDGVGSKVEHIINHSSCDIIGVDCFAMNINDLLCVGANPVGFQNHITTDKDHAHIVPQVIDGIIKSCNDNFVILSGGETEVLTETKFHISGSAYGIIPNDSFIVDGSRVEDGDVIIGLESNGLHANGWTSLYERLGFCNDNIAMGESILLPTKIYCDDINPLMTRIRPSAIINITGGGFRNLERIPHKNLTYNIKHEVTQEVFTDIETCFSHQEMYTTFNMGIGMMVIVKPKDRNVALSVMSGSKVIGDVRESLFESSVIVNGENIT
jgi:phosphoribosylformylglycinamidine cyclo-ligase